MIQNQGHSHNKIKITHVKKATISPIPNSDKHINDQVLRVNSMNKRFPWGHSDSKALAEPCSDAMGYSYRVCKRSDDKENPQHDSVFQVVSRVSMQQ